LFGVERVLVICPTSLKHQWQREIERLCKRSVEVILGLRRRRETGFATDTFFKVMNYDTVHADLDLIGMWGPDLVILDEAQRIKNWNTRVARSVKRIISPYALVLTGTPLENRLEELLSIVQFVDRFRLGPTFKLLHEHQVRDEVGKVTGYKNLDRIGQTLEPILVRRQKDQVLDQLPERIDNNIFVGMMPLQMKHHTENQEIVARIVQKWRRYRYLSEADQRRLMIALQRMRMACDNTYLVDHASDHGVKAGEAVTVLEEMFEQPATKAVVFSQWLRMHELLVREFKKRNWDHVVFHGGVPGGKRKDLVDRFREDPGCRLFLATDAGGVGLNLQHAAVVLNMDLPWNPAVLEQRIGRVHRLGQRQPVRVVNFVAKGTIEEGMLGVLKFKKSLFAGVLDGGEKDVFLGGSRLSKFMESVEAATSAIPEATLEDAEEALRTPVCFRQAWRCSNK
jgi:SNF2 family DNA or RNA helicase